MMGSNGTTSPMHLAYGVRVKRDAGEWRIGLLSGRKRVNTPEATVKMYIEAFLDWNNRSDVRCNEVYSDQDQYDQMMDLASQEYQQIIDRLCCPSVVPQPINFGDNPLHHPVHETIESVDIQGPIAVVRTRNVRTLGPLVAFEYHLVLVDNEWRLASILYVDDVSADECL